MAQEETKEICDSMQVTEEWKKEAREVLPLVSKEWCMVRRDTVMAGEGIGAQLHPVCGDDALPKMKSSRSENTADCGVISSIPESRWRGIFHLEDRCG